MKHAALAVLLLAAGTAGAQDVAGTINGDVGIAWREPSDDRTPPREYDTGTVLHLDVASHYDYGLLLRVDYTYTLYDQLSGAGGVPVAKDIEQHDARGGAFYAPWLDGPLGYRLGIGYAFAHEDEDQPADERSQDGGFVEAALTLAGRRVTLDIAAAALKLEGDADYDAEGSELRAGLAFHVGALDLTLRGRYLNLQRESPFDEEVFELRAGIGGAWGFPERAP